MKIGLNLCCLIKLVNLNAQLFLSKNLEKVRNFVTTLAKKMNIYGIQMESAKKIAWVLIHRLGMEKKTFVNWLDGIVVRILEGIITIVGAKLKMILILIPPLTLIRIPIQILIRILRLILIPLTLIKILITLIIILKHKMQTKIIIIQKIINSIIIQKVKALVL